MGKIGITKKKSVEINGIFNFAEMAMEINGETLPLEKLLADFDGYDAKIILSNEYNNDNPTVEDIEEDLGKFDKE